jgi:hypothetical protein
VPLLRQTLIVIGAALLALLSAAPSASADPSVRTQSGNTRCLVWPDSVVCQYLPGFAQAPVDTAGGSGIHWDLAVVTSAGAFKWDNANIPGAPEVIANDVVLNYGQTYHLNGWTILPTEGGTRFTNDSTSHGMFVSIDNVSSF